MGIVVTIEGAMRLLTWMVGIAVPAAPMLHLLGMPYTPTPESTLSTFAANEVAGGLGYAPVKLLQAASYWTIAGLPTGGQATYAVVSWTFTAAVTVYGYYVSDDTFGVSLWGEQLAAPYTYGSGGGVFALQPVVSLTSLQPSS